MTPSILSIDYHRNGISGAPFHVVLFQDHAQSDQPMVGIVFDRPWHTAVLEVPKLSQGDIEFGSNSWRGDRYDTRLRAAIAKIVE